MNGLDAFTDDDDARATLAAIARIADPLPDGASVEIVAALFNSLLAECRPERFAPCSAAVREEAAAVARELQASHERYLRARLARVPADATDVEAALTLARMMMSQRRLTEAAQIYSQLANALRTRSDDLVIGAISAGT